jgi:hypothetical protein
MSRIIAGLFDNRGDAERTVEHLVQELHVPAGQVEVFGAGDHAGPAHAPPWPREDAAAFQEGIRRKGVVVVARVKETLADRAMDVFEEYGAADLDARLVDWRGSGWAGAISPGGTGHDEDIGFATYGDDAVLGRIPRHHHDNSPAGLLGRWAMAAMRQDPARSKRRVRSYMAEEGPEKPKE